MFQVSAAFYLLVTYSLTTLASGQISCTPGSLGGSGVKDHFTTPAKVFMKKAFIQKMRRECTAIWEDRSEALDLRFPTQHLLTKVLEYKKQQIENFDFVVSIPATEGIEFFATTETPVEEKWRFQMKNRVQLVARPDFFDLSAEASSNGAFGSELVVLPGGSPGADRVKYISFRVRTDRLSSTQVKIQFETSSAVDISGFAAGIAFKFLQNGSNQEALKKFEASTFRRAQHFGRTL